MICYKGMSFCASDCINLECERNQHSIDREDLKASGLPIAQADFSVDCQVYIPEPPTAA